MKVEIIEFTEAKLAVVVVKAFLGDSNQLSSVLKVESFFDRLMTVQMQLPPFFDDLDHLSNRSLSTPHVFFIGIATLVQTAVHALSFADNLREFNEPDKNDVRLQQVARDTAIFGPELEQRGETADHWVVNRDSIVFKGTVPGKQLRQVNRLLGQVQFKVNYD